MADDSQDTADDSEEPERADGRSTAPQSEYTLRDVGVGFLVLLIGAVVAFAVPIALTL